jgi:hypothetical protein
LAHVSETGVIDIVLHLPEAFKSASLAAVHLANLKEARSLKLPGESCHVFIVTQMIEIGAFFLPFNAKGGIIELFSDHYFEWNRRILLFQLWGRFEA